MLGFRKIEEKKCRTIIKTHSLCGWQTINIIDSELHRQHDTRALLPHLPTYNNRILFLPTFNTKTLKQCNPGSEDCSKLASRQEKLDERCTQKQRTIFMMPEDLFLQ